MHYVLRLSLKNSRAACLREVNQRAPQNEWQERMKELYDYLQDMSWDSYLKVYSAQLLRKLRRYSAV